MVRIISKMLHRCKLWAVVLSWSHNVCQLYRSPPSSVGYREAVITLNGNATTDSEVSATEIRSIFGIMPPEIWIEPQLSCKNIFAHKKRKANEYLQNYGYNASLGNITRLTNEIVAQHSEIVKNNSGQFQLKTPDERRQTLIAQHYYTEVKMWKTLKLGAWPSPSIAITKEDTDALIHRHNYR